MKLYSCKIIRAPEISQFMLEHEGEYAPFPSDYEEAARNFMARPDLWDMLMKFSPEELVANYTDLQEIQTN